MAPERDAGRGARRRRQAPAAVAAGWRPDWGAAALAAAGLAVAGYLTWLRLSGGSALLCRGGSGCDIVQASRYAMFLGVPTAAWGALAYLSIGALAVLGLTAGRWRLAYLLAAGGTGFSLYLTWLSTVEIRALCAYCLVSAGLMTALLGYLVARRPRPAAGGARPGRLAWTGGAAAVGAAVLGAFVYAAGPGASGEYQEALARHLAATGAVFYGAYW